MWSINFWATLVAEQLLGSEKGLCFVQTVSYWDGCLVSRSACWSCSNLRQLKHCSVETFSFTAIIWWLFCVTVLKLLKMAKGIRALLDTVMQALPQVGNLGLLFFLLFFIFAALGVELFGRLGEWWFIKYIIVAEHCWYNRESDCWRQLRVVRDHPSYISLSVSFRGTNG